MKISMLTPISIDGILFFMDFNGKKLFNLDNSTADESLVEKVFENLFYKKLIPQPPTDLTEKIENSKGVINARVH